MVFKNTLIFPLFRVSARSSFLDILLEMNSEREEDAIDCNQNRKS